MEVRNNRWNSNTSDYHPFAIIVQRDDGKMVRALGAWMKSDKKKPREFLSPIRALIPGDHGEGSDSPRTTATPHDGGGGSPEKSKGSRDQ